MVDMPIKPNLTISYIFDICMSKNDFILNNCYIIAEGFFYI